MDKMEVQHLGGTGPQNKATSLLFIENDEEDRYIIRNMLAQDKRRRYAIEECNSIEMAKARILEKDYDVILLDLGLEDSQGLLTLQTLLSAESQSPILVLTGINDEQLGEMAIKLGAEDYLPKAMVSPLLLARAIGHAIERHRLMLELRQRADADLLTGLANRHALFNSLNVLLKQSARSQIKLAIALLDLDGFKAINDTVGHNAGDALLKSVAKRLKAQLRETDMAVRYGGDEFVILITNYSTMDELRELMERKVARILEPHKIKNGDETITVNVGVSCGIAEHHPEQASDTLIAKADAAMYESKREGMNQIHFA